VRKMGCHVGVLTLNESNRQAYQPKTLAKLHEVPVDHTRRVERPAVGIREANDR